MDRTARQCCVVVDVCLPWAMISKTIGCGLNMCGITYGDLRIAAALSEAAYQPKSQADSSVKLLGFTGVAHVVSGPSYCLVTQSQSDQGIVTWIAFRGTQLREWMDINADRKFLPAYAGRRRGLVHRGFLGRWRELQEFLRGVMQGVTGRVIVTGHSLGGALATLCAADLGADRRLLRIDKPDLITFGCPLVGSASFNRHLLFVTGDVVRITNGNDPIPWLFAWPMYQHPLCDRIHLDGDGDFLLHPSRLQLLSRMECGRAKGVSRFLKHLLATRSPFRAWLQVTSVFDHTMVRYRTQLDQIFQGRDHEFLD